MAGGGWVNVICANPVSGRMLSWVAVCSISARGKAKGQRAGCNSLFLSVSVIPVSGIWESKKLDWWMITVKVGHCQQAGARMWGGVVDLCRFHDTAKWSPGTKAWTHSPAYSAASELELDLRTRTSTLPAQCWVLGKNKNMTDGCFSPSSLSHLPQVKWCPLCYSRMLWSWWFVF